MGMFGSYVCRIWRRKATCLAIFAILLFCILSFQLTSKSESKASPRKVKEDSWSQGIDHQYLHKKLQESRQLDPELANNDVFDPANRGVHFIPGVPGHTRRKLPKPEPKIHPDEIGYYKERNKLLYEAKAKETKAKTKLKYISPDLGKNSRHRGDLQPELGDDNLEYGNAPLYVRQEPPGPVYYGDSMPSTPHDPTPYVPQKRIIHLDLKGAPPKISYLKKVLQISKNLGATGVLMEYEDMLPYQGYLEKVAAGNHYTSDEIKELIQYCQDLELEVIPLVQTFGHLEFVLKLSTFSYLRDVPEMPESICPCHKDAMKVVESLIDQTMAFHPNANYLHIGCDEVYHLGECEECQGQTRTAVFVDHVVKVSKYVKEKYNIKSIIWDDMLRNFMTVEMEPLKDLVEPMLWVYAENIYQFLPSYTIERYAEVFSSAWTASAFKGAHGPTLDVPDVSRHLTNNLNWLEVMKQEEKKFDNGFTGIVITGWQRYDHFAVLCEILPVGLPSLAVDLVAVTTGFFNSSNQGKLLKEMDCVGTHRHLEEPIDLYHDPFLYEKMSWCYFPGAQVFKLANNLNSTKNDIEAFVNKAQDQQGWITDYNVRRNYSTPFRLDEGMEEFAFHMNSVSNLIRNFKKELAVIFDDYTVAEWIEQNIYPLHLKLKALKETVDKLKRFRSWPRRPLPILKELSEFGVGISSTSAPLFRDNKNSQRFGFGQNNAYKDDGSTYYRNEGSDSRHVPNMLNYNNEYRKTQLISAEPPRLIQSPDYYRQPYRGQKTS